MKIHTIKEKTRYSTIFAEYQRHKENNVSHLLATNKKVDCHLTYVFATLFLQLLGWYNYMIF